MSDETKRVLLVVLFFLLVFASGFLAGRMTAQEPASAEATAAPQFGSLPSVRILDTPEGYIASSDSEVYHIPSCAYVGRIKTSNKVYFDSREDAERSGRRPCSRCRP